MLIDVCVCAGMSSSSSSSFRRVQAAIISDVWNRVSYRPRGGLQVPPQHVDGEETPPAL